MQVRDTAASSSLARLRALLALPLLLGAALPAEAAPSWLDWLKPRPAAVREPAAAQAQAFAAELQAAIASGEWGQVARYFPRADTPTLDFLRGRWHDMRSRALDPVAWEVRFSTYYANPSHMGGRLAITAREASGHTVAGTFDVELVRRGTGWVVGESLPILKDQEVRVTAHHLDLDLRKAPGQLTCVDALTLEATGPDARLFLQLAPGLKLDGAEFAGQPYPAVQVDDLVYLARPAGAAPQVVSLRYSGKLDLDMTGPAIGLPASLAWYPRIPGSAGANFELAATVPPGLEAAATGALGAIDDRPDGRTFHWHTLAPIPAAALLFGTFQRALVDPDPLDPQILLTPGQPVALAGALVELASDVARFYTTHYGNVAAQTPYLVETAGLGGLGASNVITVSPAMLQEPTRARVAVSLGLARAWAARDMFVGTAAEKHVMEDGSAIYMAVLYRAQHDGAKVFRQELGGAQTAALPPEFDDPAASTKPVDAETRAGARGVMIMHMLRHTVGNKAFDKAFRSLYAEGGVRAIDLTTFRQAFEKASKHHLEGFFDQWVEQADVPTFTMEDIAVAAQAKGRFEVTGTLVQPLPAFALSLPVVIVTAGKPILYSVPVKGTRSAFRLITHAAPKRLLLDPLHDVLTPPLDPVDLAAE